MSEWLDLGKDYWTRKLLNMISSYPFRKSKNNDKNY